MTTSHTLGRSFEKALKALETNAVDADAIKAIKLCQAADELLEALNRATSYLADLNGCEWIKGEDAGSADMRQRAKALQSVCFSAIARATS
jgi:hypothetical protein